MGRIITVANPQGGSGKTTTSINLSAALGTLGYRVLLVDLDPCAYSSSWCGIDIDAPGIREALDGETLSRLSNRTRIRNVEIIRAGIDTPWQLVQEDYKPWSSGDIAGIITDSRNDWDWIVIDTPPANSALLDEALTAADFLLVPLSDSFMALERTVNFIGGIFNGITDSEVDLLGVLLTRIRYRPRALDRLRTQLMERVFDITIRESALVDKAYELNVSVLDLAPDSEVAIEFMRLAKEVCTKSELRSSKVQSLS